MAITVTKYDAITLRDHFSYGTAEGIRDPSKFCRLRGVLAKDGVDVEAWIEWRLMDAAEGSVQARESKLRPRNMTVASSPMTILGQTMG
jgi:hypothetical protein